MKHKTQMTKRNEQKRKAREKKDAQYWFDVLEGAESEEECGRHLETIASICFLYKTREVEGGVEHLFWFDSDALKGFALLSVYMPEAVGQPIEFRVVVENVDRSYWPPSSLPSKFYALFTRDGEEIMPDLSGDVCWTRKATLVSRFIPPQVQSRSVVRQNGGAGLDADDEPLLPIVRRRISGLSEEGFRDDRQCFASGDAIGQVQGRTGT